MTQTRRWQPSNGSTRLRLGQFLILSMKEFNKSQTADDDDNLFFYGFLTLITLIGVTNIVNTWIQHQAAPARDRHAKSVGLTPAASCACCATRACSRADRPAVRAADRDRALLLIYKQLAGHLFAFSLPWGRSRLCAGHPGDRLRHHDGLRCDDPQRQHRGYAQRRKFVAHKE